jgi:hypothetical protein
MTATNAMVKSFSRTVEEAGHKLLNSRGMNYCGTVKTLNKCQGTLTIRNCN